MPGFCKSQRVFHGFLRPDFANQDYIRCLAQGVVQGSLIAFGINSNLTLVNDGFLVGMHKFNRVFNRNDVTGVILVAEVYKGSKRA